MEWFEYLIIIGAVLFVGGVIFLSFYLKKKGKSLGDSCCSTNCVGNCKTCQELADSKKNALVEAYRSSKTN